MGSTPTDHEKRIVFKNNQTHSKHCFPPCLVTSRILDDANPSVLSSRTKNHSSLNLIYFSIPLHLSFLLDIKWLNFLRKNFLDLKILCENSTGSGASGTNWLADY